MEYQFIKNPLTNRKVNIKSKIGKNILNNYINQSGGKYIASGAYGCIYSPMIPCVEDTQLKGNYVSKIINKKDIEAEFTLTLPIHDIDKSSSMFIVPFKMCNVNLSSENIGDIEKCSIVDSSKPENYVQLLMKNGGISVSSVIEEKGELYSKLRLEHYKNIINGVKVLLDNMYIHNDLKPHNIVFDGKKMRIIDFGLFSKMDEFEVTPEYYFVYPADILFYDDNASEYMSSELNIKRLDDVEKNLFPVKDEKKYHKGYYSRGDNRYKFYDAARKVTYKSLLMIYKNWLIDNEHEMSVKNSLLDFIKARWYNIPSKYIDTVQIEKMNEDGLYERILNTYDVFSLGIVLSQYYKDKYGQKKATSYIFMLKKLIFDMTSLNPYQRPSIKEVSERFDNILKIKSKLVFARQKIRASTKLD